MPEPLGGIGGDVTPENIIKAYEFQTRTLIAWIQAFINHHRYPDFFNVPDLEKAEAEWREANEFNVAIYDQFHPTPVVDDAAGSGRIGEQNGYLPEEQIW